MNIQLPIESVDSLVDITLGKRTDISYHRDVLDAPPKISYTISFSNLEAAPWIIYLHPMADSTEITFPLYFEASEVLPTPLPGGGTMEITIEEPPVYDDPIEKAKFDVCHSVWLELQLQEGLHAIWALEQQASDIQQAGTEQSIGSPRAKMPELPPEPAPKAGGGNIGLWFDWYHAMLASGHKCTLRIVANKSHYSHGYLKVEHARRQAKYNQTPNQI